MTAGNWDEGSVNSEDHYIGSPVINVFDNLLPDSDVFRKCIAERVGASGTDTCGLLTALGHNAHRGAIRIFR